MAKLTAKRAASQLESIRNDMSNRTVKTADLIQDCDAIGSWIATQCASNLIVKLQKEAHELRNRLEGRS